MGKKRENLIDYGVFLVGESAGLEMRVKQLQVLLAQHGVSEGAVPQGCDSRAGRRDVEGSRAACVQPPLLTGVVNNC